jgi:two-component system, cell cycle response regulator DivK
MPERKRILLVEDHRDILNMFGLYLSNAGLVIETATDGLEALQKAAASPPDAIVMDIGLPTVDGWNVARRLKADTRTRDIPIIAISGRYALAEMNERARAVGFATCLVKPCNPRDVLQALLIALA